MKENRFYICEYCIQEFEPKRRRVQKYCSNTCRSKAHHAKKTDKNNLRKTPQLKNITKVPDFSPTPKKTKIDSISTAGISNAAIRTLTADSLKDLFTKEPNRLAQLKR